MPFVLFCLVVRLAVCDCFLLITEYFFALISSSPNIGECRPAAALAESAIIGARKSGDPVESRWLQGIALIDGDGRWHLRASLTPRQAHNAVEREAKLYPGGLI